MGEIPGEVKEHVVHVPPCPKLERFKEELVDLSIISQSGLLTQKLLVKGGDWQWKEQSGLCLNSSRGGQAWDPGIWTLCQSKPWKDICGFSGWEKYRDYHSDAPPIFEELCFGQRKVFRNWDAESSFEFNSAIQLKPTTFQSQISIVAMICSRVGLWTVIAKTIALTAQQSTNYWGNLSFVSKIRTEVEESRRNDKLA